MFLLIGVSVSPARNTCAYPFVPYPPRVYKEVCDPDKQDQQLVVRIRKNRSQDDSIARFLTGDDDCADNFIVFANVRGRMNSLMAGMLEDHIWLAFAPDPFTHNRLDIRHQRLEHTRASNQRRNRLYTAAQGD